MKIAVISKSDERGGGASVVASNLSRYYKLAGHESDHFHLLEEPKLHPFGGRSELIIALKWIEAQFGYRDHFAFEKYLSKPSRITDNYDVVHLHDMSTVYGASHLGWLATKIPTIWTIHDCSPFTAGCLYPGDCHKFVGTCGDCPQLGGWPLQLRVDRTRQVHAKRREVATESNIRFTAPSRWMIGEYLKAGFDQSKISFVPNAIDANIFHLRNKKALREKYRLDDHNGPLILFSAAWLADSRKGPELAAHIVRECKDLNPKLLLVGRYSEEAASIFAGLDIVHFGFVKNEAEKAEYFALADVALMLSGEENAPLTVIESMACGTPVFGLDAGGVRELMVDDSYEFIHSKSSIDLMITQLRKYLQTENRTLQKQISEKVVADFSYENVANQYISKFNALV